MDAAIRYATDLDDAPCKAIISLNEDITKGRKCSPQGATEYASRIIGCYRARDWVDPQIFTMALVAVLVDRHPAVVAMAADPVRGIARKYKFAPSLSEVADELDAIEKRLSLAAYGARQLLARTPRPDDPLEPTREITDQRMKAFIDQTVAGWKEKA